MFTNNFDPVAFNLFAFEVRWYSLAYIFGILFVYANPLLRDIPLKLAEKFADLSQKSKMIPIIYLLVVFFFIPFLIIILGR